ncbi:NAD-dependent succinate-semialdehyde dehydrogenase [Serratia marcescens]|uniref:NAD-dependent succinate-semialdehyde dehydrogenase n=4 Tax=Serratia marcescens TaxID=615 RepID=UPI000F7F4C4F|nr:NAD-dependent succinate-semialdehyde dehydrogenase [Serratia marcescens]RTF67036.1 NAD-dependent succinate-semialdehyde dehydrogenase [Serratia marcescens]RTF68824.1 NAD-dependent succinate-semialdehyde dehydrogenase [Serratia marcescens]RTG01940.1 NAD-dependent succinate-semialdehyde dehydrogenase [Serratia marcescens]RTG14865.1 NAD-dependent succinate-semialdehyde dehydrogenase [Serratia marcescens]RTG27458.1 NAD-dependent succinate-semialdehyde dehydrogenase [Serratia marcescens]
MKLNNPELLRSQCLINGEWCDALSGKREAVINPATGAELASIPLVSEEETQQAIAAAQRAQNDWKQLTAKQRSALLLAWADKVLAAQEDLAQLMTAEQGKSLAEARGEVTYAASFITWFAEEAKRVDGAVLQAPQASQRLVVVKQPIGVCAAITPWNFPAAMITRKAGPGWAAGCTGVIRPASQTPFSALAIAVLAERAGLPAGVCNVITGPSKGIGGELTANPDVRKLSFTGSTEVGAQLLAQCAPTIKKTSMELGGNAPFIVFDDADLDAAVAGAVASKYRNAGQTCVCTNRFLVQDGVYDAFAAKLKAAVAKLKVGNGLDDGVTIGPLINPDAVEKVREHIADAVEHGASVLLGGKPDALGGNFFTPTILTDVPRTAKIFREETFGPVAPLIRFSQEADAVELANDTPFGLAAYFYSRDIGRVMRVAEALEYGIVGINEGLISTEVAPFGGMKHSGLGREGSKYGIEDYLEIKYLCLGGVDA